MRVLVLDDEGYRHEGFDRFFHGHEVFHAYTLSQFKMQLARKAMGAFDVVCFDHDIGGRLTDPSGHDCAMWFVRRKHPKCRCLVHSWNTYGADRIASILIAAGHEVVRHPYGEALRDVLPSLGGYELADLHKPSDHRGGMGCEPCRSAGVEIRQ